MSDEKNGERNGGRSKLTAIDGGKASERSAKEKEVEEVEYTSNQMVEMLPALIDFFKAKAEINRNYYEHLIEQGFTEKEALEIVKSDTTFNQG
jgi:hypothetical protein